MNWAKVFILTLTVAITGLITINFVNTVYAQESEQAPRTLENTFFENRGPTLFVLNDCPHCASLKANLEQIDLGDFVYEEIEVTSNPGLKFIHEAAQICGVKDLAVPLFYFEEKCYIGKVDAEDAIKSAAGILEVDGEEIDLPSDGESPNPDNVNNDDESTPIEGENLENEENNTDGEDNSGGSLQERLDADEQLPKTEDIDLTMVPFMIAAPSAIIAMGYYMITKFKL